MKAPEVDLAAIARDCGATPADVLDAIQEAINAGLLELTADATRVYITAIFPDDQLDGEPA